MKNHFYEPVGAALRVGAVGIGAPNVVGTAHVTANGNLFHFNTFGVLVEAAFPVAGTALHGDIDLTLAGNQHSRRTASTTCSSRSAGTRPCFSASRTFRTCTTRRTRSRSAETCSGATPGTAILQAMATRSIPVDGDTIPNGARVAYDANKTVKR